MPLRDLRSSCCRPGAPRRPSRPAGAAAPPPAGDGSTLWLRDAALSDGSLIAYAYGRWGLCESALQDLDERGEPGNAPRTPPNAAVRHVPPRAPLAVETEGMDERGIILPQTPRQVVFSTQMPDGVGLLTAERSANARGDGSAAPGSLRDIRQGRPRALFSGLPFQDDSPVRLIRDRRRPYSATLLSGKAYATAVPPPGGPVGEEPRDRWTKPSAVVVDAASYSDGSLFPLAYRDLRLGPLVGDPVAGTGTSVAWSEPRIVPGLACGVPQLPYSGIDGVQSENHEVEPTVPVPSDPGAWARGRDPQLDAAVRALMPAPGSCAGSAARP